MSNVLRALLNQRPPEPAAPPHVPDLPLPRASIGAVAPPDSGSGSSTLANLFLLVGVGTTAFLLGKSMGRADAGPPVTKVSGEGRATTFASGGGTLPEPTAKIGGAPPILTTKYEPPLTRRAPKSKKHHSSRGPSALMTGSMPELGDFDFDVPETRRG